MVDGQSGIPRGKGEVTPFNKHAAGQCGPQSKGGSRPLLENWTARGQTGRVGGAAEQGEAQQEMGTEAA